MIINLNNIDLYYITIGIFLISLIVQMQLQSKVKKYSKQKLSSGKTGAEVAQQMLNENGIYDVKVP